MVFHSGLDKFWLASDQLKMIPVLRSALLRDDYTGKEAGNLVECEERLVLIPQFTQC